MGRAEEKRESFRSLFTWRRVLRYSKNAALFYCAAHVVSRHLGEVVICSGPSMYPTIHSGDLVWAERLSISNGTLCRGDIVGFLNPSDPKQLFCKRIEGLERELVGPCDALPNGRVPLGHVFLLGDNRIASSDSRDFGPVPLGLVQVRLTLRLWPFTRAGWISDRWFWEESNS